MRRIENFGDAAEILANTLPDNAEEWKKNMYGLWLQGEPVVSPPRRIKMTWDRFEESVVPAVKKLKRAVLDVGGSVIEPPTLRSFIADVKEHIKDRAGAALSVTLLTHRQGGEELVLFGREIVPLVDLLESLVAAGLDDHNIVFTTLACGFARGKYATWFQDAADLSLLVTPANDIEAGAACRFQTLVTKYRNSGMNILDALEKARFETIKSVRDRLQNGPPPKLPFHLELLRSIVVRSLQREALGA